MSKLEFRPTQGTAPTETIAARPLIELKRAETKAPERSEPRMASPEELLTIGRASVGRGPDPVLARATIEGLSLALEGARTKAQKLANDASDPEKLTKLVSVLRHAVAQTTQARESQDVLGLRQSKELEPALNKLVLSYVGLLSTLSSALLQVDPFGPGGAGHRREVAELMQQLEALLSTGIETRAAASWWNPSGAQRQLPVTGEQVYPALTEGQSVPDLAIAHHLRAEEHWAKGQHVEAAHELWLAAVAIDQDEIVRWKAKHPDHDRLKPPPLSPTLGLAMLNLADALTAAGLESMPIKGPRPDAKPVENRFDPMRLYLAAAGSVAVLKDGPPTDPVVLSVLDRVIAGLGHLGEPGAASAVIDLRDGKQRAAQARDQEYDPKDMAQSWAGESVRVQYLYPDAWTKISF